MCMMNHKTHHKIVLFSSPGGEFMSVLMDGLSFVIVLQIIPFTTGSMCCSGSLRWLADFQA